MSISTIRSHLKQALDALDGLENEAPRPRLQHVSARAAGPEATDQPLGIALDMSRATRSARLPEHHAEGPTSDTDAPSSYVLIGADMPLEYQGSMLTATEHGGGTLVHPRYVLTAAHVVCSADGRGGFTSELTELRCSVAAACRAVQTERFASNEVWIHPYYEGVHTNLRFDLALIRLPHASRHQPIRRENLAAHAVEPNEVLRYYGMGSREPQGQLHETIHSGTMVATDNIRSQIVELHAGSDTFEQGFSGGPMYDNDEQKLWAGTISGYLPAVEGGERVSHIIPATLSLPWVKAMINALEAERRAEEMLMVFGPDEGVTSV